jgi:GNAT superfamily N-acetyltransferase
MEAAMVDISQSKNKDDIDVVRELLFEYLSWASGKAKALYNQDVDVGEMLTRSMSEIDNCAPPSGRLLIARVEGRAAGMISMKRIRNDACVIKRMYVRPEYRGKKIGRSLLNNLIQAAREIRYSRIHLDSANFMKESHPLYRSVGFKDIAPYP